MLQGSHLPMPREESRVQSACTCPAARCVLKCPLPEDCTAPPSGLRSALHLPPTWTAQPSRLTALECPMRLLLSSAHGPAGQQAASRQGVHHHQPVHVAAPPARCSPLRRRPPCCCWPAPAAQGENENPRGSSAPEGARLLAARGYWRARILLPAPLPHRTFHLLQASPAIPLVPAAAHTHTGWPPSSSLPSRRPPACR